MKSAYFRVLALLLAITVSSLTVESQAEKLVNNECPSGLYVTSFFVEQYPVIIRNARLQGVVRMRVKVNQDGNVVGVDVVERTERALVPLAKASVEKWKFRPTDLLPVTIPVLITFEFQGEPTAHVAKSRIEADLPCSVKIITNPTPPSDPTVITPKDN